MVSYQIDLEEGIKIKREKRKKGQKERKEKRTNWEREGRQQIDGGKRNEAEEGGRKARC